MREGVRGLYEYCANDPIDLVDPTGRSPLLLGVIAVAGLGYGLYLEETEGPEAAEHFFRVELPETLGVAAAATVLGTITEAGVARVAGFIENLSVARAGVSTVDDRVPLLLAQPQPWGREAAGFTALECTRPSRRK